MENRALVVSVLAMALGLGCGAAQSPRACGPSATCKAGEACVMGQCRLEGAPSPVAPTARRVVLAPEAVAFVVDDDDGPSPTVAPLGASVGPRARILLKFPAQSWSKDAIAAAYLVFDRADGVQAGPGDVRVRASRIVEPWSVKGGAGTTWASPPRAEPIPGAEAIVAPRGPAPIRVAVTPWAAELGGKSRPWGLRVEGDGEGAGFGVPIATGLAGGAPPRLEVYFK